MAIAGFLSGTEEMMTARKTTLAFLVAVWPAALAGPIAAQEDFGTAFASALTEQGLAVAAGLAEQRLAGDPADATARFALGAAHFLGAVEGLGQGMYRLGLQSAPAEESLLAEMPFLRLPLALNPAPEPFSAEALRAVLADFESALATSEATLAAVPDGPVALTVDLARIRLDFDGDGTATDKERLANLIAALGGQMLPAGGLTVRLDDADVLWLQGYAHLLMGMTDILLAHDFSEGVDQTFHTLFPAADLPSSPLRDQALAARTVLAEVLAPDMHSCWQLNPDWTVGGGPPDLKGARERYRACTRAEMVLWVGGIADAVAFLHLFDWPLIEPERPPAAREHFLRMIALSRESWTAILAETDDDREWIPGPQQASPFVNMPVDQGVVDGWLYFLDQAEGVLNGDLLIPHWRFQRPLGLNVRRMFEEPRNLDPIMLITGAGAIPYIEEGPIAAGTTIEEAAELFGRGMLGRFFWFN